jgi:starvation-inducible DNA-binding protein
MPPINFYGRKNLPITFQPNIGLDAGSRQSVVEMLNVLLADEAVLAQETRRAYEHEPAKASGRSDLQPLSDGQYRQIKDIVSAIAERISILGGSHLSVSEESISSARLEGNNAVVPDAISILADHEAFIRYLRGDAQKCSEEYEDQGTSAMLVSVMQMHEKMAWMLRSYIQDELTGLESKRREADVRKNYQAKN